ncbi:MarR family winged helix-turn-helix transcriptional regulator [Lactococcus insecticola]|uniref:HTH marR-type domain-containing protein n=1 Tax=Pseudolactococcus insecticola TaxID=2709158 RepID=A0A6A0BAD2_9LACT|nr:MarR family transcriptional regulator [Lactococcus insecticola]GFH41334.1 hypothetical protein Hs20B_17320 [Lactococcus insecticola]
MFKIIRTIGGITRKIQSDSNHQFKSLGLSNNLFIYVIRVTENPGMFLAELADAIQIDRTTSFRTVQKLEKAGYVTLENDPDNQKIRRIFPTKKAADIYPLLHDYEKSQSDQLLVDLTSDEINELTRLIGKLRY